MLNIKDKTLPSLINLLLVLAMFLALQARGQSLVSDTDNIKSLPEETITEYQNTDITEDFPVFDEYLYLPPQGSEGISTRSFGSQGKAYDVNTNQNYRNAFNSSVSNHYYAFSLSRNEKVTGRAWNMPLSANLDIALYKWSTVDNSWKMLAFSQHPRAVEEQLSYVANSGKYLFEVAMNGTLSTNLYSFNISTQSTYDSQEADDNYWQARFQRKYQTIVGTLDNNYDKDFIRFTNTKKKAAKFRIIGGDYTAQLRSANGSIVYTLPSNSEKPLNIPAGTWYWVISSPSKRVNSSSNYVFSQVRDASTLIITFDSDSQRTYSRRVNWGSGTYFPIYEKGVINGTVLDIGGNPVRGSKIQIRIKSSINNSGLDFTYLVTTDTKGKFSQEIQSPTGVGYLRREGAKLYYHYDVHKVEISTFDKRGNNIALPNIIQVDDISRVSTSSSEIYLNDVAYYTYNGK